MFPAVEGIADGKLVPIALMPPVPPARPDDMPGPAGSGIAAVACGPPSVFAAGAAKYIAGLLPAACVGGAPFPIPGIR